MADSRHQGDLDLDESIGLIWDDDMCVTRAALLNHAQQASLEE